MNNIYSKIDVSSGGSLMGTVDKEALVKVSKDWSVISYYQTLANNLPADLENRDVLYQKYQEYIQKLLEEKERYE